MFHLLFWKLLVHQSVTRAWQMIQTPVSPPKMTTLVHLILTHLAKRTAAPPWEHFVTRMVTAGADFSEIALTVPAS